MFEFFFKYPVDYFWQGELLLPLTWWQLLLAPVAIVALGYLALGYLHLRHRAALRDRLLLSCVRGLALSLLLFSLSRPMLQVDSLMPQPNVVALLFDNSISMSLPDADGNARSEYIEREFDADDGDILRDLRARFDTRLYGYGEQLRALDSVAALDFGDASSNLEAALQQVRESMHGEPLAGLVVVSDGASDWSQTLEKSLRQLRADGTPVHTVGLGAERYARDIELREVKMPRRLLHRSRVVAQLVLTQQGYDGREVELVVEDDSRIVHQQFLQLRAERMQLPVPLSLSESGARTLKFSLTPLDGEAIVENNHRYVMPSVSARKLRILHFEGEPRFELKFVRRALDGDDSLRLTGLIRTADAKFYRVGVESADELRQGFPLTRDELFVYDALILGSVEISLLSRAQQQLIVDFVSERGGGLLLLGGRQSFTEGGYADSLLKDIFPVVLGDEARPDFTRQVKIEPGAAALVHPALLLDENREQSMARWQNLPPLTIVNPIRQVKPGADLLLSGRSASDEAPLVAMAAQRYGRGKVVAFAVQNSWLWQMHHEIELEDQSHELLWRQLLRWLVEDVPQRLTLTRVDDQSYPGGPVRLRSEALDAGFEAIDQARASALITLPDGREQRLPLLPDAESRGFYTADFTPELSGDHDLLVELEQGGETISSEAARLRVNASGAELHDSELNAALLRQVAALTGGEYFGSGAGDGLLSRLDAQQRQSRVLSRLELWDMPILFFLLIICLCFEWAYRRWRKLV